MRQVLRLMLLLSLCLAQPALAQWEYTFKKEPTVSSVAYNISQEIRTLPEPLFMTDKDMAKVEQLLSASLREQNAQIELFRQDLLAYQHSGSEEDWFKTESTYKTLRSIAQSKEALLQLTSSVTRDRLTGFGPYGVLQFKKEWENTRLNMKYLVFFQIRSVKALIGEVLISPVPVIWVGVKVFFIYLVLAWWLKNSKRLINLFYQYHLESKTNPPLWVRLVWYISRAHRAIAVLIAITLSLRVLANVDSLQHLIFLEIFTWWILGGSIAVSFILEFVYRNSRSSSKALIALRLSTIRRYIWSIIVAGVILQISMRTVGKGTIYYWIYNVLFFWFVLVTMNVLLLWRKKVFEVAERISDRPVWVNWAIDHKETFLVSIAATAVAAFWITVHSFKHRLISALSGYTLFSQALAYLFRIEVAKQTGNVQTNPNFVRIKGNQAFEYVLPGSADSRLFDYGADEIKQLSHYLMSDSPAICVISGERGIGTTTLLRQLLDKVKNAEPVYLNCPYAGYSALLKHLAVSLGMEEASSEIQILSQLRKSDTSYLIAVDNAQRLVKPMVGGLSDLIRLTNLLRRSKKNHRVVMAVEKASWRFVDRARGERLLFDLVTFLPRWSEKQIGELLDSRINRDVEHPVCFDGLVVPKQWDQEDITEEDRAKQGFYRILWHYSDGNPTVALRFFRLSLNRNKETQQVVVRLFTAPESQELEKMPKPMLAVLRSIVQLEVASTEELSECTQLSVAEVLGTLRYFQSRGYIEWNEDKARVSDHWFRHITNVLDRQHLLVK